MAKTLLETGIFLDKLRRGLYRATLSRLFKRRRSHVGRTTNPSFHTTQPTRMSSAIRYCIEVTAAKRFNVSLSLPDFIETVKSAVHI